MMGTFDCVYETPCHWCTKWDKKCDRKIGKSGAYNGLFDGAKSDCDHEWIPTNFGGANTTGVYTTYFCKKCGASKNVYS